MELVPKLGGTEVRMRVDCVCMEGERVGGYEAGGGGGVGGEDPPLGTVLSGDTPLPHRRSGDPQDCHDFQDPLVLGINSMVKNSIHVK